MKRSLLLFALCFLLIGQSCIVLISGLMEHHPLPSVHALMGMVLIACLNAHLLLHRGWIKNTLSEFDRLPRSTQAHTAQNFVLLAGYITCAATGLRTSILPGHLVSHLHLLSAVSVVVLQAIHLNRHRKWIQSMLGRLFTHLIPIT
jgi:hypothetical protein